MRRRARRSTERVTQFETSCFSGVYITGDVTPEYLAGVEASRNARRDCAMRRATQLDLNLVTAD